MFWKPILPSIGFGIIGIASKLVRPTDEQTNRHSFRYIYDLVGRLVGWLAELAIYSEQLE